MATRPRPARVSPAVFAAAGYFLPRLLFLHTRWAPQVHFGDIAWALDGFPEDDLDLGSARFWAEWRRRWVSRGEHHLAVATGSTTVAGQARAHRAAAACFHWAEFMDFDDAAAKAALRRRVRDAFERSLECGDLDITQREVAAGGPGSAVVRYWLLRPPAAASTPGPLPCVVVCNGLDSVTEVEPLSLAEAFLERGIAAVLFEGPGQGLQVGQTPLPADPERVVARLVTELHGEPGVDAGRLAFLGVSFGGHIALRVAQRLGGAFRCVVNLSGGPRMAPYAGLPRRLKDDFSFVLSGGRTDLSPAAVQELFDRLEVDGRDPATTDVLSVHGALDDIFPLVDLQRLHAAWGDRAQLLVHEREAHVCLNQLDSCLLTAADWVSQRLAPPTSAPSTGRIS
ncbi:alpha/beta hydrolase [Modestobacter sp. I12A-02628]|uniref:Alpha/beta hydrolase n=1 Tax=Goekera deserti TaxID=2497753 RepID=A0A7K3WDL8_9ACTN|nr:alpha/beta hydrolase [Goekera deserti]NDI46494.1 alpha/beta hydrolase [Goekera deserti]NEL54572.1 alpha/beta hydrolase [Goekera deserti]